MLNDHERYVLEAIEHGLYDDDPDFADAFRAGRYPRLRRIRHWPSLLLTAGGLAIVLAGLPGRIAPLVVEGLVVAAAGFGYGRWQARLAKDRPARRARRAWRHRR
jgi:Protein of unknown function (DUF3040)